MKKLIVILLGAIFILTACTNSLRKETRGGTEPHTGGINVSSSLGFQEIKDLISPNDANGNGIDDYADIVAGARIDAENKPQYDGGFYAEGGYPPDNIGVCTDVIWRAFAHAGYDLKSLVDADIAANTSHYMDVFLNGADPNIDFRRVRNLNVFLSRHAELLTVSLEDPAQWAPGDIVVFQNRGKMHPTHIAILSNERNSEGWPFLIHNAGQSNREEDALQNWAKNTALVGHYRWTPTKDEFGTLPDTERIDWPA